MGVPTTLNLNRINDSVGKALRKANYDRVTANSHALSSSFDLGLIVYIVQQGWIQHGWGGGGGGGGALPALVLSCVGHVCRPPINLLHYCKVLLGLYLNCNCCSQFAYHHVITQITVSHFASNNFLLYHEK
jgi:hypothetical protein